MIVIVSTVVKPEGTAATDLFYVITGNSITISGFTDINGNPPPFSTWMFEGSVLVSDDRFNTDSAGQLLISSVNLTDAGNYSNTLMNTVDGDDMSISNTVELIVLGELLVSNIARFKSGLLIIYIAPASMPRMVMLLNVGAEFVNISWANPGFSGVPVFSQFLVEAVSTVNTVSVPVAACTNELVVSGLKPGTDYNLTVRAQSTHEQLGLLISESSEILMFNTTLGGTGI